MHDPPYLGIAMGRPPGVEAIVKRLLTGEMQVDDLTEKQLIAIKSLYPAFHIDALHDVTYTLNQRKNSKFRTASEQMQGSKRKPQNFLKTYPPKKQQQRQLSALEAHAEIEALLKSLHDQGDDGFYFKRANYEIKYNI